MVDYVKVVTDTGVIKPVDTSTFGGTPADDSITNAKLANMSAWTIKLRNAATTGDPSDVAITSLTEESTPASGMMLLGSLADGSIRRMNASHFLGGGGGGGDFMADGSVPMTANFPGGGFDITNVANVTGTGDFGNSSGVINVGNKIVFSDRASNHSIDSWANTIIRFNAGGGSQTADFYSTGVEFFAGSTGARLFECSTAYPDMLLSDKGISLLGANRAYYRSGIVGGFSQSKADGSMAFGMNGPKSAAWVYNAQSAADNFLISSKTAMRVYMDDTGIEGTSTPGFALQYALGAGKSAGDAITWTSPVEVYSDRTEITDLKAVSAFGLDVTPVAQQAHLSDPTGTSALEAWAANVNTLLETFGLMATS